MKTATSLDTTSLDTTSPDRAEGQGVSQISSGQLLHAQRTVNSVSQVRCMYSVAIAGVDRFSEVFCYFLWSSDYVAIGDANEARSDVMYTE